MLMEVMIANDHSVYAGSVTGFIHKINGDAASATAKFEGAKILDLTASSDALFALTLRKEIHELDANSLEVRRMVTMPFNATCMTYVSGTSELWVGDSAGKIHVLAADSLEQTHELEGNNQALKQMITSPDSSMVVSGNKTRHIIVWSTTSKEKLQENGNHKQGI